MFSGGTFCVITIKEKSSGTLSFSVVRTIEEVSKTMCFLVLEKVLLAQIWFLISSVVLT